MIPLLLLGTLAAQARPLPLDFGRDIRPILSDRCFLCHGSGDNAEVGGFRLDLRGEATRDLGGYAAIVPGDSEASELIKRVRHEKVKQRMPPAESNLLLSQAEIALLARWIDEGAVYAQHWAFVSPVRAALPEVQEKAWARDDIDRFVLARMEREGLSPSEESDRATWLRRASFDLTGLPPTVPELDTFLGSPGEEAFGAEVERLLASPRHAERMATIWLDAARYADTYGYQSDRDRRVWPWRDWVIDSYAKNQPFDEFLTWQLAGDLLPDATQEQRLATAFNRLHRQTNEGGSTEEEYRIEYVADRVDTMSTAFMGLTVACARCHDHKFDPIRHEEYYGLSSFFDDIDESGLYSHFTDAVPTPALDLPTELQRQEKIRLDAAVERAREALLHAAGGPADVPKVLALGSALQGFYRFDDPAGDTLANSADSEKAGLFKGVQALVPGHEGLALEFNGDEPALFPGVGAFRRSDPFTIGLWLWLPRVYERAVVLHRSRAWTDSASRGYELLIEEGRASAALVHFWPGNALRVRTVASLPTEMWVQVTLTWDGSSRASGLRLFVDGQPAEVEIVRDHLNRTILGGGLKDLTLGERFRDKGLAGGRVDDLFVIRRELTAAEVSQLFRGDWTASTNTGETADPIPSTPRDARNLALEELRVARSARDEARDAVPQIMTMSTTPVARKTHLLDRGSYLSPRQEVVPHTPSFLPAFRDAFPANRLGLAHWLTDPGHPLTARVEVNRLWQLAFGRGLVETPEDFGSQGVSPSHPELLDALALDLIDSGWDRQVLLKRMLLSATYRQGSQESALARERDPGNRLLSHVSRRRLSAEMLRDSALFTAGLLVEKRGGSPVKPYQPAGLWKEKSGTVYQADHGEGLWRRSLYTFWKRTSPPPSMMIMDAAKRDVCVVKRHESSSPLQALLLWNDPQYVEAARVLAQRVLGSKGGAPHRANLAFRMLTSRAANSEELRTMLTLLKQQRGAFKEQPQAAEDLLGVGEAPLASEFNPISLASWTVLMQTLMSFDAVISRP